MYFCNELSEPTIINRLHMQQYNTDMDRVATLIDSYREAIGGVNSKNAKAIQDYIEAEEKKVYETIEKRNTNGEDIKDFYTNVHIPSDLENRLKVNEQLLGYFYLKAAGSSAEKEVLAQLLAEYYDNSFFSQEQELFLLEHFMELANYVIKTSYLVFREYDDLKDVHLILPEIISLINQIIEIPENARVFNPFAGFGQFAVINRQCHYICEESYSAGCNRSQICDSNWLWAWMKVALFANNCNAVVIDDNKIPSSYDYVISYIPFTSIDFFTNPNDNTLNSIRNNSCDNAIVSKISSAYQNLTNGGKMILIIPDFLLLRKENSYPLGNFWKYIVYEGSVQEIVQLPSTCNGLNYNFCIVVINKGCKSSVTMIDARFAAKKNTDSRIIELEDYLDVIRENKKKTIESNSSFDYYRGVFIDGDEKMVEEFNTPYFQTIDLDLYNSMRHNNGRDSRTGLRKIVMMDRNNLKIDLLLPQVYVSEKPEIGGSLISLSSLCSYVSMTIRNVNYDLPMDTPWIKDQNLSYTFQKPLQVSEVEKVDCPNNPSHTDDYRFNDSGEFSEERPWSQWKPIGRRIIEYRKSTYLDANKCAVLLKLDSKGNPFAVVSAQNKPIAIGKRILVFCPKKGVELVTLAAVLKMPIVYNQIIAYERFGLSEHLEDIIVPYDKWLIDDEVSRLINEERTTRTLTKANEDIKKSVRMRKHALTQSMSSLQAMFNALNAYRVRKGGNMTGEEIISRVKRTTVNEAFEYLSRNIKGIMPVLEHISDVEYSFGDPEWIEPESFIGDYISKNEKGWITFNPIITWVEGSNKAKDEIIDPLTGMILFKKGEAFSQFLFPKAALEKILDNIVSNALSHGFVKSRNDYHIKFSWYAENKSINLLIENNGYPIPDDRDPASLLEYGVSTALHSDGHNGIGCNEIDDIMQRYDGKVELISSPQEEYTVKYLLTFYRSNSVN